MRILRNVTLVIALLVFAIGILGASIWRTSAQSVSESYNLEDYTSRQAQSKLTTAESGEATESVPGQATETVEEVDYFLAYPGILPDHLLYPLKMIRDKIWLFLTTDALKKAELYLLFADKRLGAAKALVEGNKLDVGVTTLTKAEKYLEQAVNQERAAHQAGKDTAALLERLSRATLKHEEVMLGFKGNIPDMARPPYDSALQYAQQGYQKVMERLGE